MRAITATVLDYLPIIAAGILQGIGQDGHLVEGSVVVDGEGKVTDTGGLPARVEGYGTEGITEDVADQLTLSLSFYRKCS
jgi:hypothetical protein